jgi:hypothetical protein
MSEAHLLAGRLDRAQAAAERGFQIATRVNQRARQAYARRLLAEIAARRDPLDAADAEARLRDALARAEELEMRPLQAHCHLGLSKLYRRLSRLDEAHAELSMAVAMLREMGMTFWLPEAEAELAQADGAVPGEHVG